MAERGKGNLAAGSFPETRLAALTYLGRGWAVIPLIPSGKAPLIRWQEYQGRLPDEAEVRGWFRQWPDANVGIVTGRISGIAVLDVDPMHGGAKSLEVLERDHGTRCGATLEARTGGGGRHLYFANPAVHLRNKVGLAPGLDLRADGGLVVAPPSRHPSGRRYEWRRHGQPAVESLSPMPGWLVELARAPGLRRGHPLAHWRVLARRGVQQGERNNALASFAGHLLWHGVDPEVVVELLRAWNQHRCQPPLDDEEVVRTVESIVRLHAEADEP